MSSVRSTSDGRDPVTRKRVPDREEQGKPSKDAPDVAVVIPLNNFPGPADDTVTAQTYYKFLYRIQNTCSQNLGSENPRAQFYYI